MKNARDAGFVVTDCLMNSIQQFSWVKWLSDPIKDMKVSRPEIVAAPSGICRQHDDRGSGVSSQSSNYLDEADSVAVGKLEVD